MANEPKAPRAPSLKRPEGMKDEEWTLYRISKSPAMARAIVSDGDLVFTSDKEALADCLQVSKDAERDSLKRFLNLQATIGAKLAAAQDEYDGHAKRSARLYRAITGVAIGGSNGAVSSDPGSVQ